MTQLKAFLKAYKLGFLSFGHTVAKTVNVVLLFVVYFFGVGAVSVVTKLFGRSFLDIKHDSARESYWVSRESPDTLEETYRQF